MRVFRATKLIDSKAHIFSWLWKSVVRVWVSGFLWVSNLKEEKCLFLVLRYVFNSYLSINSLDIWSSCGRFCRTFWTFIRTGFTLLRISAHSWPWLEIYRFKDIISNIYMLCSLLRCQTANTFEDIRSVYLAIVVQALQTDANGQPSLR